MRKEVTKSMSTVIEIDDTITVGDLAEKVSIPVTKLIAELMKNGVMATVNERIDFDTAEIIVGELGLDYELKRREVTQSVEAKEKTKKPVSKNATARPPVVAVMGHVDHGKTSLLDAIRDTKTADDESGGITQHISAYQATHGERKITFLDTPGHEAFAAIREHGARLTDLAIIVVAADDGIKPQTEEAIRFAKNAGVKIIVAVNKIDKPEADLNRIKQQLADHDLLIEEWGGDTVLQPVSAITKEGIPELLDMVLLVADVEDLRADSDVPGQGLIIESHMEQGKGAVAVALIEAGMVEQSDFIVAGATYARIRTMATTNGDKISTAGPATPVVITGFKELPEFGDAFSVVSDEKTARTKAKEHATTRRQAANKVNVNSSELLKIMNRSKDLRQFNVYLKADVKGSLTSLIDSLRSLATDEVAVRIIGTGVGAIADSDVQLAQSSDAVIYGFHVQPTKSAKQIAARDDNVTIKTYDVIYELIDDVKTQLSTLLAPEVKETELGRVQVKGVFKTTKNDVICGGEVTKGKLTLPALARIIRDKEELAEVEVIGLQRGPSEAKEVVEGEMCGLHLKTTTKVPVELDDRIELFTRETITRKL
jgi:translation initiation factor IF-2